MKLHLSIQFSKTFCISQGQRNINMRIYLRYNQYRQYKLLNWRCPLNAKSGHSVASKLKLAATKGTIKWFKRLSRFLTSLKLKFVVIMLTPHRMKICHIAPLRTACELESIVQVYSVSTFYWNFEFLFLSKRYLTILGMYFAMWTGMEQYSYLYCRRPTLVLFASDDYHRV